MKAGPYTLKSPALIAERGHPVASSFAVINSRRFIRDQHARFSEEGCFPCSPAFPHLTSKRVYRAARIARSRTEQWLSANLLGGRVISSWNRWQHEKYRVSQSVKVEEEFVNSCTYEKIAEICR